VKREDLKHSFDQIKPSEAAKSRMLDHILNYSDRKKGMNMSLFQLKKAIPALALTLVIAGGLLTYRMLDQNSPFNSLLPPNSAVTDDADLGREDAVAPLLNQFQIDDRHYIFLSDDLRAEYGLPASIEEGDIGEKITVITSTPDKSLEGCEVYSYLPAGGEAVVAVKKGNEYQLFRFFSFESYINNQDEDAIEYLKLYGINSADDIAKVQFLGYSEESRLKGQADLIAEITDRDEIVRFYSFYSALKNSSDKYFDRLFNFQGMDARSSSVEVDRVAPDAIEPEIIPPDPVDYGSDQPIGKRADRNDAAEDTPLSIIDMNETQVASGETPVTNGVSKANPPVLMDTGGAVAPSQGASGEALANPIAIRIYNQRGVYYESMYYQNIGFISRYEVGKEFAEFLNRYINK